MITCQEKLKAKETAYKKAIEYNEEIANLLKRFPVEKCPDFWLNCIEALKTTLDNLEKEVNSILESEHE